MLHGIYRYARRRSRLSAGIAIVTVLTLTSVLVGLAISSGPAAGAAGSAAGSGGALSKVKAVRPPGRSTPRAAKAHAAPAHQQARPAAKAKLTRQAHPAKPAVTHSAHPYTLYDSVTPSQIPAHHKIATYADGSYAVRPSQVAARGPVLWIDVKGSDTSASVLDVEPGDATPAQAAAWARHKLGTQPKAVACIYTMRSEWAATRAAISKLPSQMCSRIRWWIADPTGVPHIVPGSHATQWYWGNDYDISSATASFPQLEK